MCVQPTDVFHLQQQTREESLKLTEHSQTRHTGSVASNHSHIPASVNAANLDIGRLSKDLLKKLQQSMSLCMRRSIVLDIRRQQDIIQSVVATAAWAYHLHMV